MNGLIESHGFRFSLRTLGARVDSVARWAFRVSCWLRFGYRMTRWLTDTSIIRHHYTWTDRDGVTPFVESRVSKTSILQMKNLAHRIEELIPVRLPRIMPQRGYRQMGDLIHNRL